MFPRSPPACAPALRQKPNPTTAGHLDLAIRRVIGLDGDAVEQRFEAFAHEHPALNARQVRFLSLLKSLIASAGAIELERLYEPPFTTLDPDGIDGLFEDETQIDELLGLIASFESPQPEMSPAPTLADPGPEGMNS